MTNKPSTLPRCQRGEVWWADLDPRFGHEQSGLRPVLIVSATRFNIGSLGMALVVPLTTTLRNWPTRVPISPPEGGITQPSEILCDQLRAIDLRRISRRIGGPIATPTFQAVELVLRTILEL